MSSREVKHPPTRPPAHPPIGMTFPPPSAARSLSRGWCPPLQTPPPPGPARPPPVGPPPPPGRLPHAARPRCGAAAACGPTARPAAARAAGDSGRGEGRAAAAWSKGGPTAARTCSTLCSHTQQSSAAAPNVRRAHRQGPAAAAAAAPAGSGRQGHGAPRWTQQKAPALQHVQHSFPKRPSGSHGMSLLCSPGLSEIIIDADQPLNSVLKGTC